MLSCNANVVSTPSVTYYDFNSMSCMFYLVVVVHTPVLALRRLSPYARGHVSPYRASFVYDDAGTRTSFCYTKLPGNHPSQLPLQTYI